MRFAKYLNPNPNIQKIKNAKPRPKPFGFLGAYVWNDLKNIRNIIIIRVILIKKIITKLYFSTFILHLCIANIRNIITIKDIKKKRPWYNNKVTFSKVPVTYQEITINGDLNSLYIISQLKILQ